jgi:hypothetical protein
MKSEFPKSLICRRSSCPGTHCQTLKSNNHKLTTLHHAMNTIPFKSAVLALTIAVFAPASFAQLAIPSDGSDGALIVTSNRVIDLSQAVTGAWSDNNAANAGKGIYDSNQWAVVFKYSSVLITNGATLSFANHGSHAPVVWLVNGNVTIYANCAINVDGNIGVAPPGLAEPGPGGFRAGTSCFTSGIVEGPGFGPGGGQIVVYNSANRYGGNGSYGDLGSAGSTTYGNPSLIPLIGGSGGAGGAQYNTPGTWYGGGGGGGAILIASAGTILVVGNIHANGGASGSGGGGGSGGGIRLVCNSIAGTGVVQCLGGSGTETGGVGRIRLERVTSSGSLQIYPDPSIVPLQAGDTPLIWLPTNGPTARIVSINSLNAPSDPRSSFGTYGPDLTVPQVTNITVIIETANAESASVVKVRAAPRANGSYSESIATLTQTNSLSPLVLRWTASIPVKNGFSAVQARVIRP